MPTPRSSKPLLRSRLAPLVLLLVGGLGPSACSDENQPTGLADDPVAEAIDAHFETVPDWEQPAPPVDRAIEGPAARNFTNLDDPVADWRCQTTRRELVTRTNRIFAPESDFGIVWPGAILRGQSVRDGEPRPVVVERAPLTVFTDLAVTPSSVTVESPDAVSVNEAIAQLVTAAGNSYRSRWSFVSEEVTTVKQGSMALGLNAGYAGQASAAVAFDESRSLSRRVFAGRAVEEMFVVRFADDELTTPADLFGASITPEALAEAGVTDENAPVYVRSVTYGRMVVFTAVVRGEEASEDFGASIQAMFEGVEGGGGVEGGDRELLESATYHAQGYGPNAGDALGALQDVELERFFTPTTADRAVPLYFEIVTVKDPRVAANLGERATYEATTNCRPATGYELTTTFKRVRARSGGVVATNSYRVEAFGTLLDSVVPNVMVSAPRSLPDGGVWVRLNKSTICELSTRALGEALISANKVGGAEVDQWRSQYPYRALPRGENLRWDASTKIRDTGFFLAERTIEFDVRLKLEPSFD